MKNMLKDVLILFIITVLAGGILGFVQTITKEPIAVQKEKAKTEAYETVFETANSFKPYDIMSLDEIQSTLKEASFEEQEITEIVEALDQDGATLGYIVTVVCKNGYAGDISFALGILNDLTLNGISILSISETPGLGMKAEEILVNQFAGKNVNKFSVTKTGATIDSQIDAISGATITSNAITEGVNAGLYLVQNLVVGGNNHE